ncbi:histidine kinase [Paenibacillus sp. PK3_47]|uniref:sensor histidine kinase n=1 Tax=Paenibacillus sp. PK3_47 TaxID=2072642 RepID=UPI00201DF920|nr:sensor histidine kinase KdpD [Paenibacillus sp. PK3_47]UQZ36739.1 histidine kinase [Paenibacillus sp. PK3_47]
MDSDGPGYLKEQLTDIQPAKRRGKLKIFVGYASGVGKTYAMLLDAREMLKDGVDVVAGYIEPHVRPETSVLLEGLELMPPLAGPVRGNMSNEFNLDLAIRRNPELILLDELSHANAAGCRHKKRYQDVEELLRAGIHVYTTVNVQHIESLQEVTASITGFSVREMIPDEVFDSADHIELVDIEPDDLIDRLHKGKIYPEEQARQALTHFYVKSKLTALREIALRYTADQVNRKAAFNRDAAPHTEFYTKDHILVCLSSAPSSQKVIRTAARMAEAFHGTFTALYVETADSSLSAPGNVEELRKNLRLAEQLGAQIATVYGEDVPGQIAEYAKTSRVSKIVIGRSQHKKRRLSKPNLVDKLTTLAPGIEIYIIPDASPAPEPRLRGLLNPPKLSLGDTVKSTVILAACTLIGIWFQSLGFREANIITVFILGVLINAMVTNGRLYSAATSVLGVLIFNYFFTYPYFSFQAYDSGYPVTFLVMLTASFISSTLTMKVKEQARHSAQKAYRTEVLLETSRKLQQAENIPAIMNETANQLVKLLDRTIIFYPVEQDGLSEPLIIPKEDAAADAHVYTEGSERAVAEWVYKNNKRAGATTDTFSAASCLYLAVRGGDSVFAIAAIVMEHEEPLDAFEKSLMIAMLGECALALEKEQLNVMQKKITSQIEQEQLRGNLLRSISHDLRTPLTSISGNAGILISNSSVLSEPQKLGLYNDIHDDSIWLIHLVENLLSITRIDNGSLNLNMQAELMEEVISEALLHINRSSGEHVITTAVEDDLLMAKMDPRLIIQVLINIIDNAIKYTQEGSIIQVSAKKIDQQVLVEISDNGPGIPPEAQSRLFDMFYTANNSLGDGRRGLGLGLALCKSIIQAHGGTIEVRDNVPKGTVFSFTLQSEEVIVHE